MAQSHTTKRFAPDALGLKALITTTSLAVTLGGWAVLAVEQPTTPTAKAPIADTIATQPPVSGFELNMASLPTIVAPPAPPPKIVVASPPPAAAIQRATHQPAIQVAPRPATEPQPAAAPPAPAAPPAVSLPLRAVSAPPQPVARTRSSR